jgi:hypothetical protein
MTNAQNTPHPSPLPSEGRGKRGGAVFDVARACLCALIRGERESGQENNRWDVYSREGRVSLFRAEAGLFAGFVLGEGIGDEAAFDEVGFGDGAEVAGFREPVVESGAEFVEFGGVRG